MDRVIEKKGRSPLQWGLIAVGVVAVVFVAWQLLARTGGSRLKVDPTRLTTAVVEKGEFREYYPFDGSVEPAITNYLDVEQGGRVEQVFVEGGQQVKKGDLILRFANVTAQRNAIETETRLLDSLDTYHNTEFNKQTSSLLRQDTLLDLDHQILDMDNKFRRYDALMKSPNSPISREQYETTRDQLKYLQDKRVILARRNEQEEIMSNNQLAQAKKSIDKLNESMDLLNRTMQALEVRAPISGYLSTISAEVGQNIPPGQRIGQIDLLDKFKIRTRIDQAYITRVQAGTPGHVQLDGKNWEVTVQKIYPEVKQNVFEADVMFTGEVPPSLKRGQTVTVELSFGSPSQSLMVAKGGFYQYTGGRWVYLVAPDGKSAHRTDVRLGRQNPRQVEVLEGLREGDRIIASGYDSYNDIAELRFSDAISMQQEKTMIIETENLQKVYRTDVVETTAVDGVNFTLAEGEFVSIMGPSGCGKSTLLHLLGLIDSPSDGVYRFLGEDVAKYAETRRAKIRKAHIGFVFQSFNLIDELTVYENVELPLVYGKVPHAERKPRVEAVMEKMDIAHRRGHFPAQLSGGQQQRVAVARALVTRPNLILADEPTGNLDSEHGDEVMKLLLKLNEEGTTILMVTHSASNAAFSSRIVSLLDGRVVSDKTQHRQ